MRTPLLAAVLAALALPSAAAAATPAKGAVTPTAKKVSWTGSIVDPLGTYDLVAFFNDGTSVRGNETCGRLTCEVFALTVADGGQELRIKAGSADAANVSMDISGPDGFRENLNTVDYLPERELVTEAVPGEWVVRVYGTSDVTFDYEASAEINLPGDPSFLPVEEE